MLTQSRACWISVRSCRSPNRLLSVANRHQTARHKRRETCETYLAAMPQSAAGDQNSTGYAAALLARAQSQPERHWMDAAWLGGLTAAATTTWAGLAAHPGVRLAALCYIAVEGLWYGWSRLRTRHLSRLNEDSPDITHLVAHFERFLELRNVFCIRQFLSGWFLGAPPEAVLRGNVEEFVAYGFHCKLLQQLTEEEAAAVSRFVDRVEEAWGVTFEPGFNAGLPFMAHVWEPLRAHHKPLLLFAFTEALARTAHLLMLLMGFRPARQHGFTYWHSKPRSPAALDSAAAAALSPPMSPVLRRRSTGDTGAAQAAHKAPGAVHQAAEQALDATLSVTSAAAAVVAAQHPHGGPSPLSPRVHSAVGYEPALAAACSAPAASLDWGRQGSAAAAASRQTDGQATAAASVTSPRRRNKGDSASDFHNGPLADAAAAAAAAAATQAGAPLPPLHTAPSASPADSAGSGAGGGQLGAAAAAAREGSTRSDVPVVFLHGVGFGVLPYLHLVRGIQQACESTPVIMVEVPHVALRLCWEARGVDEAAHAIAALLARHGYRRVCVVGHSYGTFVASRLCQLHPQLVHSASLLDPVAMLTCYPQLLYNFIYREPSAANFTSVPGAVDMLRFLCSRDLTIAQAFCRKFHWSELMMWPQDLPRRSLVVLSGRDDLVPSELVMQHMKLTGHPGKVMHHPDLGHGGILLDPAWQAEFVANLRAMLLAPQ